MDDSLEWGIGAFIVLCVGLLAFAIISWSLTPSGVVVDKYFDDSDLVCSKGCYRTDDCWTIKTDGPWYNNTDCVSQSEYYSIEIGDEYVAR